MGYEVQTVVDLEKCTGCGRCVAVCPSECLALVDGRCRVVKDRCMHCGQCGAVCADGAVRVTDLTVPVPAAIQTNDRAAQLFQIVSMRRSCRNYTQAPVSTGILQDLVTFGLWAPSGTNAQKWAFTILPDRAAVVSFAVAVAAFYRRTNRQAENPLLRLYTKLFRGDVLGRYRRRYYDQIRDALDRFDHRGEDLLFHGATAAIVISVDQSASCAHDDAIHAAQNIVLAAEAMDLGSCLIGFAVEAARRDRRIGQHLQLPAGHHIYSVVAIGHPRYPYPHPSGRRPLSPRIVSAKDTGGLS